MSTPNEEEPVPVENELNSTCVRRKTNVSPWRDKKEFDEVYEWIYGADSTHETKEKAYRRMKIWKLRRLNLTPGTILSTLLIIEAELKDAEYTKEGRPLDACAVYSSAFTRFLNYMSAISQAQNMKTMYAAARELNIDPFLVDLRHLCAHGHTMPSLDVFRRTSRYCLNWLREFYWDLEKETMVDVDAKFVRKKNITAFDENVREMFLLYDAASEAVARGYPKVGEAKKHLPNERFSPLKRFAAMSNEDSVENLTQMLVKSISRLVRQGNSLKDLSQIFVEAFLEMTYFFERGCDSTDQKEMEMLIARHQALFQTIATHGFVEDLYHALVEMAENEFENVARRKGAGFWAKQIVVAFVAFKKVKMLQKKQREQNSKTALSLSTINVKAISRDLLEAYESLGYDVKATLMFGDSIKCPWTLSFTREYLLERVEHINEYTVDIIKSCMELIQPPLSEDKNANLAHLIDVYSGNQIGSNSAPGDRIYTLHDDVLKNDLEDSEMKSVSEDKNNQQTFGIWTRMADGQEWHSCPLGRLMWE